MPASQLSQLKSALAGAGLDRKTYSKKEKKAFKKGGARETDRAKTLQKLEEIRKGLNKFDQRETRLKHDVGGRNLKGVVGRPSAAKQAGLEQRRNTLLPEHELRGHTGTFQDRRFGESNPSMSLEDRMLERYTRERQRGQGKKGLFNLEDDEGLDGFDEGLGGLTHGGRSVMDLPGDDFMMQGLGEEEEETPLRPHNNFGGFAEQEQADAPPRVKSKQEVMSEIIAKSKGHKYERQQQQELDSNMRDELDGDINDLLELLQDGPSADASSSRLIKRPRLDQEEDVEYDQFVKTLAFEARAKPKDRTKTEDELALEEKERLEKAELKRLKRMRGEEDSGDEKERVRDKRREGDDLEDDFVDDDLLGPGLTREGLERMGKGNAVEALSDSKSADEDEEEEEEEGEDENEDEEEEEDEDDDDDEDEDDEAEDVDDDEDDDDAMDFEASSAALPTRAKGKGKARTDIPYTFTCPATLEELEDIMDTLDESALPIVVQRIRALHHPSLAQGNKEKLLEFLGVLLDYTLVLAAESSMSAISAITPHIIALVRLNPISAAQHFVDKLALMQKNLVRGLARGATQLESKTFPGAPELVLLRLVGAIWSSSDFSHPVVAPAVLLIGQYLGHGRIRQVSDIASGLFLCTLLAQYESSSRRIVPETINFIASTILALFNRKTPDSTYPDIQTDVMLYIESDAVPTDPLGLVDALAGTCTRADLAALALRLVTIFAGLHSSSDAFIELFTPLHHVLRDSIPSSPLKALHASTVSTLSRMLNLSATSRQPLALQSHKPIPIASHAPRFESDFAPGRHYDPDAERNATAKLKAMYKKERKGAIRELRKDNKFLAGEKARVQADKDRQYNTKMRRVEGEINMERAEEKAMQREKQREKRRRG